MDSEQIPSNQRRFGIFLTNSANLIAPQIFHIENDSGQLAWLFLIFNVVKA